MKGWIKTHNRSMYIVGLIVYLLGLMFLVKTYQYKHIAVASAIFIIFNIITLAIISWLYFKEGLSGLKIFGIVLAVIAIFILELSD